MNNEVSLSLPHGPEFFLDYGVYVNSLVSQFSIDSEEAFYIFEEAQDKGIFDRCKNDEEALAEMTNYYTKRG